MTAIVYEPPAALKLADTLPLSEAKTPAAGAMDMAPRADHQHPRLTSAVNTTLDANGFATITFTRTFTNEPVLVFGAIGTGTGPVPDFRGEFIKTGDLFTGVTVYGQRARALPTMPNPLNALAILGTVVTGVNQIMSLLSGFTPFEAAAGARVSVTAIQAS